MEYENIKTSSIVSNAKTALRGKFMALCALGEMWSGRREGSAVNSSCCSCRGPTFCSQLACGDAHNHITPAPENLTNLLVPADPCSHMLTPTHRHVIQNEIQSFKKRKMQNLQFKKVGKWKQHSSSRIAGWAVIQAAIKGPRQDGRSVSKAKLWNSHGNNFTNLWQANKKIQGINIGNYK